MFFKALSIVQKQGDEKNLRDKLLLVDLGNSSSPECVNSWWSNYNKHTNVPFVYQSASPKYHEPVRVLGRGK